MSGERTGWDPGERHRLIRPLVDFLHTEAAGGVALVVATIVALVWANSPWDASYNDLWSTDLAVTLGSWELDLDLREWVNDGLMVLFFFVVGLEIKRELVEGELRDRRRAMLPVCAALGGMLAPALIYVAFNAGGPGSKGWGIPMATDIAMAVGVMSLMGSRVSPSLKLFVLALAIVDDIGAIVVIAVFYTDDIEGWALLAACGLVLAVAVMRRAGVRSTAAYAVAGVVLWLALHESGIHATLAGVVLGLMTPTQPIRRPDLIDAAELADVSSYQAARQTATAAREAVSVVEWLEHLLHPWTSFVVVPLFALANAGIPLSGTAIADALTSSVAGGIVVGLVVGKVVGITGATWLANRLRIVRLPGDTTWSGIVGVSALAGIGFTVSIFVTGLAFGGDPLEDQAKVAILAASLLASALGSTVIVAGARRGSLGPHRRSAGPRGVRVRGLSRR
ncbi:MAG TPA: Na+/H+ antiporter NhaA [Acidimicrobiales bacterium]|nr:Na+/H+ antiporter NhaA [Acidimicrobiales bacterium]